MTSIEKTKLAGLDISRLAIGLWQVADLERDGRKLDPVRSAHELAAYASAGYTTFDMADHYGSAEEIVGQLHRQIQGLRAGPPIVAFTKWCPPPGPMTAAVVRAGVELACQRMQTPRIDLMQFHWWMYEDPRYLDALWELTKLQGQGLIAHIGLTNFNTDHLRLVLACGLPIVSNQVCLSLLDRRALGEMSALCRTSGVRLLVYGTLAGGFLSDKYLGVAEPVQVNDWSKKKYSRFIAAIGGWNALQKILRVADSIARRHNVSIANVATRWALQQEAVAAVIVGARLNESEHREANSRLFSFTLDRSDMDRLDEVAALTKSPPGDCGDEYRKPPFLTASGDLSHHLDALPKVFETQPFGTSKEDRRIDSGSIWEPLCGYSRAVRRGRHILVSGTTATHGSGTVIAPDDPAAQTVYILDKIAASIAALGGRLDDVVRTRIYLTDSRQWEAVARVHGHYFGAIRPANTLIEVAKLVGDYRVEIEAEALVD